MEQRKKSYYNCSVWGCLNSTINSELSFFKLPTALDSRIEWLKLIDREDLINSTCLRARVCEAHFTPDRIRKSLQRKHLKKKSVPQLLLPCKALTEYVASKSVQTNIEKADKNLQCDYFQTSDQVQTPLYISNDTPQKRKLLHETRIHRKKRKMPSNTQYDVNMFHELCDKFLTENLARVVKQQIKNKTLTDSKFSLEYKLFCLNLYYTSPQAYNLLKDTLYLPSKVTLAKMNMPVTTKIDNHVLDVLKTKLQYKSDMHRNCALVVGVMSLKVNLFYNIREDKIYGFHEVDGVQSPEPAKYAIVAMINDLFQNYKQPVGFALIAECKHYQSVSDWIDKIILKLRSINIRVRILLTDMTTIFLNDAINRSVSIERPYFIVDNRKIFYIFDPHHLVKLVRNNFINYDFYHENDVAKWHHIIQFYEMDKLKRLRLAPRLTERHMKPTKLEKTKIKYAVEVFSANVAAGLSTYKDFNMVDSSVEGTIKLIELMSNLLIFLNTSSRCGPSLYHNAFCGEEYQTSFVNNVLNFFASLKFINPKTGQNINKVYFIEGFQITLRSLLLLFEDLKIEGYSHILTKRLNQECLENLFCKIRTRNGNFVKPTSWRLVSAFRKIFLTNMSNLSKSSNRAENLKAKSRKLKSKPKTFMTICSREENEGDTKCPLEHEKFYDIPIKQELDPETLTLVCTREENECDGDGENLYQSSIKQEHDSETLTIVYEREENEINCKSSLLPPISSADYNTLDLPKNNAIVYISGYLLKKCLDHHSECNELLAYIKRCENVMILSEDTKFTHYKNYINDGYEKLLTIPPDSFVEFVISMEKQFYNFFQNNYLNCLILNSLLNEVQIMKFAVPCGCFPMAYCKKLFLRMRMYYTLKYNNHRYKQCKNGQKLFLVKEL